MTRMTLDHGKRGRTPVGTVNPLPPPGPEHWVCRTPHPLPVPPECRVVPPPGSSQALCRTPGPCGDTAARERRTVRWMSFGLALALVAVVTANNRGGVLDRDVDDQRAVTCDAPTTRALAIGFPS